MPSKFNKKYHIIYIIHMVAFGGTCDGTDSQGMQRAKSDNIAKENTG